MVNSLSTASTEVVAKVMLLRARRVELGSAHIV